MSHEDVQRWFNQLKMNQSRGLGRGMKAVGHEEYLAKYAEIKTALCTLGVRTHAC